MIHSIAPVNPNLIASPRSGIAFQAIPIIPFPFPDISISLTRYYSISLKHLPAPTLPPRFEPLLNPYQSHAVLHRSKVAINLQPTHSRLQRKLDSESLVMRSYKLHKYMSRDKLGYLRKYNIRTPAPNKKKPLTMQTYKIPRSSPTIEPSYKVFSQTLDCITIQLYEVLKKFTTNTHTHPIISIHRAKHIIPPPQPLISPSPTKKGPSPDLLTTHDHFLDFDLSSNLDIIYGFTRIGVLYVHLPHLSLDTLTLLSLPSLHF